MVVPARVTRIFNASMLSDKHILHRTMNVDESRSTGLVTLKQQQEYAIRISLLDQSAAKRQRDNV